MVPLAIYAFPCLLQLGDSTPSLRPYQCQLFLNPSPGVLAEVMVIWPPPASPITLPLSRSAPATRASLTYEARPGLRAFARAIPSASNVLPLRHPHA